MNNIYKALADFQQEAYNNLNALYQEKKIEKLEPLDGNNINCCDWLKIQ